MVKLIHCSQPVNHPTASFAPAPASADSQRAQARITCASTVASCLDTLKISFWVDWLDSPILEQLEETKQAAQATEFDSQPINLLGYTFNCSRAGTKLFKYLLVRGDVKLLFSPRKPEAIAPNTRLEIGSMSCWAPGYQQTYDEFVKFIEVLGGICKKERVSEVHLCADFIGVSIVSLPVRTEDNWITLADAFDYKSRKRKFSGITWGVGNLMLRVYDKVLELQNNANKKELFMDVWGLDTLDGQQVTRVEFQIRRPILSCFLPKIDTFDDLKNSLKSLWDYCTNDWMRLSDSPVDRNHHQSRAVPNLWWQQVQATEWTGNWLVERKKEYARKDFDRICMVLAGTGMSAAAKSVKKPDDIEGVIASAQANLERNLRRMAKEDRNLFVKKMARKINEVSGPFQTPLDIFLAAETEQHEILTSL